VNEVAFELELPPSSKVHPVFHVSKLKPCHGTTMPTLELPPEAEGNQPMIKPLAVLDWKHDAENHMVLIQWQDLYPEDATWEPYEDIDRTYPDFHLEDKVSLDEVGDVMDQDDPRAQEPNAEARPKRVRTLPKHLKDFVLTQKKDATRQ
jgi:hypothetical protein